MKQTGYVPCALLLAFAYIMYEYVCMYVCTYVCLYVYVCVRACVCVRARFLKQHCHGGLCNSNALFDRN